MQSLLQGLKVVDFSQYIPGPYATLVLAQMGAEVVKVERPGGEAMRVTGPPDRDDISAFYKTMNASKTIVELNLKKDDDVEVFERLLSKADVLVESFRPGVMDRLGFGPKRLGQSYPRLIVCSVSGFGQNGPYRLRPGHDINYLAYAGLLAGTGTRDLPILPSPAVSDYASAIFASVTVLGAVVARHTTGRGAYLDVSMADTVLAWQAAALSNLSRSGYPMTRGDGMETGGRADYAVYRTADDRFVTIGAMERHFWVNFCNAVGRPEWCDRQHDDMPQMDLIGEVSRMFESQPLSHWGTLLDEVDCCFEPVLEYADITSHPQVLARSMVREESWPDPLCQTGFPAWVDHEPVAPTQAPHFADARDVANAWDSAQPT